MVDVIIIGAGAAGLSAARILLKSGKSVCILEARERIGGRIHTIQGEGFTAPVEAGAEFMHGELPLTKALMKEANVSYRSGEGRTWTVESNQLTEGDLFHDDWDLFMDRLNKLTHDITIGDFLRTYFSDPKYESLTNAVKRFVQGYDAADVEKASALALREEWSSEDIKGFRPEGGYSQLMDYLLAQIQKRGAEVKLSTIVTKIQWKAGRVEIITDKNEKFESRAALITIPVTLLKRQAIIFEPSLIHHEEVLQHLEVGGVIKFLVEFKERIWERKNSSMHRLMPRLNFIFSDAFVPTWWTQNPAEVPLLTGWLAGPVIQTLQQDDDTLLNNAFKSLSYLFGCTEEQLSNEVRAAKVINWAADSFALGAYAYKTLKTSSALNVFTEPVENTLYFAGEAFYDGTEMGTVEAALASGEETAKRLAKQAR
jgi:monoamine oxidase